MKPAVLVIDVINDFVSGVMGSERSSRVIQPIGRLLEHARRNGIHVMLLDYLSALRFLSPASS